MVHGLVHDSAHLTGKYRAEKEDGVGRGGELVKMSKLVLGGDSPEIKDEDLESNI